MREKQTYTVMTFHTTAEAIATEKFCNQQNIPGRLIPVPREISAGCGLAWRMKPVEFAEFEHVIAEFGIGHEAVTEVLL